MRATAFALAILLALLGESLVVHAEAVTLYSQLDDSGEMVSQQPTNVTGTIQSADLGNLKLGTAPVTLTFVIQDPNAGTYPASAPEGVALHTCVDKQRLQTYFFTSADRALLADGAYHEFTVTTESAASAAGDGSISICIEFFGLSQFQGSTHIKSDAGGTIPALTIRQEATTPVPEPSLPPDATVVYDQGDASGTMTSAQPDNLTAYIDSGSLGTLSLGQGTLLLKFTIKDPHAGNVFHMPERICLQPAGSIGCANALQTYFFTAADRELLSDGAYHTFVVETGTTTSTYADGSRPVSIGFYGLSQFHQGTQIKSNADATIPAITIGYKEFVPIPETLVPVALAVSNVLFLPGIQASRLYAGESCGAGEKLWEPVARSPLDLRGGFGLTPAGDLNVRRLFMTGSGESVCDGVYAKVGDMLGDGYYASFITEMNALKADGTIVDWRAGAYDWRFSFDTLLKNGLEQGGKIFYGQATSTPYIEQTLRELAASSHTGRVTLVAHSNGGLLAKALLQKLGNAEAALLVDKLIMVGVPQTGAPAAIDALLFGNDFSSSFSKARVISAAVARELALNSPMAHHLLPSQAYFDTGGGAAVTFSGEGYAKEIAAYGTAIASWPALADFLVAKEGGRVIPESTHIGQPGVLNKSLIEYGAATHVSLDAWVPPAEIKVYQIAGWGDQKTIAGIEFYTLPTSIGLLSSQGPVRMSRPIFTEDGDGIVPVSSAHHLLSASNVKNYWLNFDSYFDDTKIKRDHSTIFEVPSLRNLIKSTLAGGEASLSYISTLQPPSGHKKSIFFFLHSPLTLELVDSSGNTTGLGGDDSIKEDIPGSTYGEFGEVKYVIVPQGGEYKVTLKGQADGIFSLDIQESLGGEVIGTATIAGVPTTAETRATMSVTDLASMSGLVVDEDGDGTSDFSITPKVGEIMSYEEKDVAASTEAEAETEEEGRRTRGAKEASGDGNLNIRTQSPERGVVTSNASTSAPPISLESNFALDQAGAEAVLVDTKGRVKSSATTTSRAEGSTTTLQTASALGAPSAQSLISWLWNLLYNVLHAIWSFLTSPFI